jgi:hypothetical protein
MRERVVMTPILGEEYNSATYDTEPHDFSLAINSVGIEASSSASLNAVSKILYPQDKPPPT